jgi:hypothetical protein
MFPHVYSMLFISRSLRLSFTCRVCVCLLCSSYALPLLFSFFLMPVASISHVFLMLFIFRPFASPGFSAVLLMRSLFFPDASPRTHTPIRENSWNGFQPRAPRQQSRATSSELQDIMRSPNGEPTRR